MLGFIFYVLFSFYYFQYLYLIQSKFVIYIIPCQDVYWIIKLENNFLVYCSIILKYIFGNKLLFIFLHVHYSYLFLYVERMYLQRSQNNLQNWLLPPSPGILRIELECKDLTTSTSTCWFICKSGPSYADLYFYTIDQAVCVLLWYCLDYCSSVLYFEIWNCDISKQFLTVKISFFYLGSLVFPYKS